MACAGVDLLRAADLDDGLCRADERAGGVDHIVEQDAGLALDVADYVHYLGLVGSLAPFVDDSHVAAELHGEAACAGGAAHVGGYDHNVVVILAENLEIMLCKERSAEKIIDGDVEKALDLRGVEIHGQDAVRTGGGDEICNELCGDGVAALGLAVLTGIAEVGDDRRDAAGGGSAHGVDHDQQLHKVVVYGLAGGLNDENVGAAHGFVNGNGAFAVSEVGAGAFAELLEKLVAYGLCQLGV